MLDQSEVATYLLRRGLISEACIMDGDFQVVDASRRNRNFKAISKGGPSYMLKLGVGKSSGDSLAYESGVYEFLGAISYGGTSLCDHLPFHYGYDEQEGVLILELLQDAVNIHEHHAQRRRCPVRTAAAKTGQGYSWKTRGLRNRHNLTGFRTGPRVRGLPFWNCFTPRETPGTVMRLHSLTGTSAIGSLRIVATGPIFAKIRLRRLAGEGPGSSRYSGATARRGLRYRDCARTRFWAMQRVRTKRSPL
jgi:hypothetical protein